MPAAARWKTEPVFQNSGSRPYIGIRKLALFVLHCSFNNILNVYPDLSRAIKPKIALKASFKATSHLAA
jgi:hypothetical protein